VWNQGYSVVVIEVMKDVLVAVILVELVSDSA
jgi:hypothetical protein